MKQNYQHLLRIGQFFFCQSRYIFRLFTLLFLTHTAHAQEGQIHTQLMVKAAEHVALALDNAAPTHDDPYKKISLTPLPLDTRILIPTCATALNYSHDHADLAQASIMVKIACPDNDWFVYGTVKQQRLIKVIVANRLLVPNTLITAQDIEVKYIPERRVRYAVFHDTGAILGTKVKRKIRSGVALASNLLCFVCKGDSVKIIALADGLSIKTQGIAQQDGTLGQTIAVKNSRSNKQIMATVIDVAQVGVAI